MRFTSAELRLEGGGSGISCGGGGGGGRVEAGEAVAEAQGAETGDWFGRVAVAGGEAAGFGSHGRRCAEHARRMLERWMGE